jgi:crotonobetainyl-CoA:carnitine CoA-transferase CaiB-like acyl-CoA transferase
MKRTPGGPMPEPAGERLPLDGVRVVDFTRLLPGALATLLLADMGADVIKLEIPPAGDYQRSSPPAFRGSGAAFTALNRDKRSVCLDYRTPEGLRAVHRLVDTADVLIESALPGSLRARALDFDSLHARLPRLVYCSLSGFGLTGPLASHPAHGTTLDALSGYVEVQRASAGETIAAPVAHGGLRHSVLHAGHTAAMAICAALYSVATTGSGVHIDASCWDSAMAADPFRGFQELNGLSAGYGTSAARPAISVFETADSGHLVVAAPERTFWESFCEVIGRPDLVSASQRECVDIDGRKVRVYDEIARVIAKRPLSDWEAALVAAKVPSAPVLTANRFGSEHAVSRDLVRTEEHTARADEPQQEPTRWVGSAARFGSQRGRDRARQAPAIGTDTVEVLTELGFGDAEIAKLVPMPSAVVS